MKATSAALIALFCLMPIEGPAHDLQHRVGTQEGVKISLFFGNGDPFSYESFEIYREGETIPFQTGRTDALGQILFLPDRSGTWRIKAYSEDGHGAEISLPLNERLEPEDPDAPLFARHFGILIGVAIIFGVFGLVSLLRMSRT